MFQQSTASIQTGNFPRPNNRAIANAAAESRLSSYTKIVPMIGKTGISPAATAREAMKARQKHYLTLDKSQISLKSDLRLQAVR